MRAICFQENKADRKISAIPIASKKRQNRHAEIGELVSESERLLSVGEATGRDDGFELQEGRVEIFVDYNVLEFRSMRHLGTGAEEAARDCLRRIGSAVIKAPFERFNRGRQNEDAHGAGEALSNLTRTLPIDLEQNVMALGHFVFDPDAVRTVVVAVYECGFEKFVARLHGFEFFNGDEMVFAAVDLSRTRIARREGDGKLDRRLLGKKRIDERRFPAPEGAVTRKSRPGCLSGL